MNDTSTKKRLMKIGALVNPSGAHPAGWRSEQTPANADSDIDHYIALAKKAEAGKLDIFFLADVPGLRTKPVDVVSKWPYFTNILEPVTALTAIARETEHIGLGATISTSYELPFNVARLIGSLDRISGGRAAWNAVTTAAETASRNFSLDPLPSSAERYARAFEFVELVRRFWRTWEQDSFVQDKENSIYYDPEKLHLVDFEGEHFAVKGAALNIAPSPQGQPVITQAGASDLGRKLGAMHADVVYGQAIDMDSSRAFRDDIRRRAVEFGRAPDDVSVLLGIAVVVDESESAARERYDRLRKLLPQDVARFRIAQDLEIDLTGVGWDDPIPLDRITEGAKYFSAAKEELAEQARSGRTLGDIAINYERGQRVWLGSPTQIADRMQEWYEAGAADGFMLNFPSLPDGLNLFIDMVVPELQSRGVFRTDYSGSTLRDNFGE